MNQIIELTDQVPYGFPFIAWMRGTTNDHKREDVMVIVHGYSGMEKHYFRVQLHDGSFTVANDSMLYVSA